MKTAKLIGGTFFWLTWLAPAFVFAQAGDEPPANIIDRVGIDQRLSEQLPANLVFRDETGATVYLGDYFDSEHPVILVLAYFRCPMLCTEVLNGLVDSLHEVNFDMGRQYRVVTVSFDPQDSPELAAQKKASYVKSYGRSGTEDGWHFLTGDSEAIQALTRAVGFRYVYDPVTDQYAHGSGIMVLTPQGKLSRYFFGIEYPPRDLRLALVESSAGKIGTPVDQLLLLCYHYDPATGKYTASAMALVRLAGGLTILVMFSWIGRSWYHDWKRARRQATAVK
ncbi:MAG TPA: SCO family protein [Pirellulales bacterium]|nr:SCO family protein [Pirellulales bacterium]